MCEDIGGWKTTSQLVKGWSWCLHALRTAIGRVVALRPVRSICSLRILWLVMGFELCETLLNEPGSLRKPNDSSYELFPSEHKASTRWKQAYALHGSE